MEVQVKAFFDKDTFTLTYVVSDPATNDAVVIDPVLDYDPVGSKINTKSYDEVKSYIQSQDLNLVMVLETHAHADHISSAPLFKQDFGDVPVVIGEKITMVQETFKALYNLDSDYKTDGSQFDQLLKDGIYVGFNHCQAHPWIREPIRCFNCQRFNHVSSTCRFEKRCLNCGVTHDCDGKCSNEPKCANCSGPHMANYGGCNRRKELMRNLIMNEQSI